MKNAESFASHGLAPSQEANGEVYRFAEFALDSFDRSSTQRDVQRALELADAVTPRLG